MQWRALDSKNAVVYGVNPGSQASHASFSKKLALPYPLLSDPGGKVARLYRSWLVFVVRRTVYAIDAEGNICFAQRGVPSPSEIAATLRAAI